MAAIYPDAKFILSVRGNEEIWWRSIARHTEKRLLTYGSYSATGLRLLCLSLCKTAFLLARCHLEALGCTRRKSCLELSVCTSFHRTDHFKIQAAQNPPGSIRHNLGCDGPHLESRCLTHSIARNGPMVIENALRGEVCTLVSAIRMPHEWTTKPWHLTLGTASASRCSSRAAALNQHKSCRQLLLFCFSSFSSPCDEVNLLRSHFRSSRIDRNLGPARLG